MSAFYFGSHNSVSLLLATVNHSTGLQIFSIFPFVLHCVSTSIHKIPYPAALNCLLCDDVTMKDSTC